ncbi:PASTA domain-containing protein [Alloacidobacterium sp.]|uniref:PASTA domain-containing protein n=1 Tax=Alloacidobacterium sp. TaxID=2951999 RepID=UPI002D3CC3B4|nr:PASTA domain-containing protein [Alloacidobacterium sp.]HYK34372.1 PASTA domain-containing protein [Alloacidobacterium sp.]
MIGFFRLVLVVLLLCVVALLSAVITMHFAIHGAEVSVPDFRGLIVADAIRKAASLDLNLSVDNRFYSAEMPAGRVLTQAPAPGAVVRREWRLRVTQSLGPQRIPIPKVIGQPERAATIAIRRAGLDLGNVARMPYAGAPEGAVIAQNPAPDAEGVERPSMSLLVADTANAQADGVVMPDLTGQLFSVAAAAVTHAGLKLAPAINVSASIPSISSGNGAQTPAAPVPPGTVISQSPVAGYRVDASTPIQLAVTH